ncbi:hypothetical protein FOTG_18071 [Fusarium oxysporum f. sp. vasinfectum 25433]|uniref:Uncharacterized protein n=1 Tax=Fusarium oxysporum f. sp. vasinfectum 25433 TaxID=1089449 RepID=X0KXR6_FUSOX|nr:hypothetical protein FOTG_18071 [Fusarium oxysporum f. sp. vasinfectum 25433]
MSSKYTKIFFAIGRNILNVPYLVDGQFQRSLT